MNNNDAMWHNIDRRRNPHVVNKTSKRRIK